MDDLALKAGLGYSDDDISDSAFSCKVGAKYYIAGQFPIGLDLTGVSSSGYDATYVGFQAGYALFIGNNVSIEPAIRYNATLDKNKADSAFQGLIGFALHF